jgi:hypothetical protein
LKKHLKVERTLPEVLNEFKRVYKAGRELEQAHNERRPSKALDRKADRLEKGWDEYLSNTKLKGGAPVQLPGNKPLADAWNEAFFLLVAFDVADEVAAELSTPRSKRAIAAKSPTPHGSTKRITRRASKRLRSE